MTGTPVGVRQARRGHGGRYRWMNWQAVLLSPGPLPSTGEDGLAAGGAATTRPKAIHGGGGEEGRPVRRHRANRAALRLRGRGFLVQLRQVLLSSVLPLDGTVAVR